MADETTLNAVELATELTIAWFGNEGNRIKAEEAPAFLKSMHATVMELVGKSTMSDDGEPVSHSDVTPATTVRRSLASKDHIISMIDGKPYKTLRRHLSTHGLTAEQYRERYNLKPDYPMVAPAYSEVRRAMALKIGLGKLGPAGRAGAAGSEDKPKRTPRASKNG